jgi:alcohol dehydrogenase class IV
MNPPATITLLQPSRIVFGHGCAVQAVDFLAQRGVQRLLLVTSKSVRPQISTLVDAFQKTGVEVVESGFIPPEPTLNFFETTLRVARLARVDSVIAVGGGGVIDVAKLIAALTDGSQKIEQVFGINLLSSRTLPLVCLPTTAGTGAEVSPIAVLLDEAAELKKGVVSPHLVADAAFVDPLLTVGVPPEVTAATGLDALTHCIEAYANKFAHPLVDNYALQGIRLISKNLLAAVRDGKNLEARAALALGSLYGGLCLGPVNTAAVHALAYPLGGKFRIAHGVANALLLPHVLRFNFSAAPQRHAEITIALGLARTGSELETAELGVEFLTQLSRDCGVPQKLSDLGIPRSAIPGMAKSALTVQRLLKNNLRPVTEADAEKIYEAAF